MSIEEQVAAAANQKDAMLVIARALDQLLEREEHPLVVVPADPWAWPDEPAPIEQTTGRAYSLSFDEEAAEADINFKMPSPATLTYRRAFERERLHLSEYLQDDTQDWTEAYAMGGPNWLYMGNRDLVMSMPDDIKQLMIQDLIDTGAAEDAHEMGRDILKQPCETGPGSTAMHIGSGNVG